MNLLPKKLSDARQALKTLEEALNEDYSALVRDASIQRFEYTVEAVWKCLQVYLREKDGIECYSPKSCFREAGAAGLLKEEDVVTGLEMIDDRNLTAHTYHEELAEKIFRRLSSYSRIMEELLAAMGSRSANRDL
jgi:nucleotidyltransferase substrate binding protein (TIGR01987 family)